MVRGQPIHEALVQTSANAYATKLGAYVYPWKNILIYIKENNINAIEYSIDGSMDDDEWHNLVTDQDIARDGDAYETIINNAWAYIRVQIKSDVAGTHSTNTDITIGVNGE